VAITGQPYAFTGDDPLNATDPLGLFCILGHTSSKKNSPCRGSAEVKKVVKVVKKAAKSTAHYVVVHRKGELEIVGAVAAVTAIVATGGAAALGESALAGALETTATVASFAGAATDIPGCLGGSVTSCVGVAAGGGGGALGLASTVSDLSPSAADLFTQTKVVFAGTLGLFGFLGDVTSNMNGT
jgi:hypothetical protein